MGIIVQLLFFVGSLGALFYPIFRILKLDSFRKAIFNKVTVFFFVILFLAVFQIINQTSVEKYSERNPFKEEIQK